MKLNDVTGKFCLKQVTAVQKAKPETVTAVQKAKPGTGTAVQRLGLKRTLLDRNQT